MHGVKSGLKPLLSSLEDREVAEFFVQTAKVGYGQVKVENK